MATSTPYSGCVGETTFSEHIHILGVPHLLLPLLSPSWAEQLWPSSERHSQAIDPISTPSDITDHDLHADV